MILTSELNRSDVISSPKSIALNVRQAEFSRSSASSRGKRLNLAWGYQWRYSNCDIDLNFEFGCDISTEILFDVNIWLLPHVLYSVIRVYTSWKLWIMFYKQSITDIWIISKAIFVIWQRKESSIESSISLRCITIRFRCWKIEFALGHANIVNAVSAIPS